MIGRRILHYEIRGRLGRGGGGEVYLARDTRLDRDVAIKRLVSERRLDPDRISREAKALAALSHPNVVTVHALETVNDEQLLVMELVEGTSLDRLISPDGLPPERILHWGVQLAQAVAAAHEAGVLHRDLKPANIVIGSNGRLKILDFGLAEAGDDSAEDEDETISRIAAISGTVSYLAPELILGRRATASSDIFAVGVVLYEMATGRRPFEAETTVELLATVVNEPILPVRRLVPGFPKPLARWIEKSLAKIPEERPAKARELADGLEALRSAGGGIGRKLRLAAATASLVLVGGFGWWLGTDLARSGHLETPSATAEARDRRVAVLPFRNLGPTEDAYFAAGMTEELIGRLAMVGGLRIVSHARDGAAAADSASLQRLGEQLKADFLLVGTVRWNDATSGQDRVRVDARLIEPGDESVAWSGTYDRVLEDVFSVQTEIAEAVVAQLGIALFPGEQQALRRRPTDDLAAYQSYLQAIDYRHRPLGGDYGRPVRLLEEAVRRDPDLALAWAELAHAHAKIHHFGFDRSAERRAEARRAIDRALELAPDLPEVHLAHGYVYYWSERNYEAALEALAVASRGWPNNARLLAAQAFILRRLGRFEESLAKHAQARDLDPLADRHDRSMAVTLYYLGRYDEAREHLRRAVELAPSELFNQVLQVQLGWLEGDLTAARAVLDGLMAASAEDRPPEPQVLSIQLNQLVLEGRAREALERLRAAEVDVFRWTVRLHPKALILAELAHLSDLPAEEQQYAEQALAWIETRLEEEPSDARLYGALGLALASLGRAQEAAAAAERGVKLLPIEKDAVNAPYRLLAAARIHARLGNHGRALDYLSELLSKPCEYSMAWLRLDPWFAEVREHPRFAELVAATRTSR